MLGTVGWQEMMFIFLLALVIFGPKKLPELGRNMAKALTEFRKASNELKATFDRELINLEREHESIKEATSSYFNNTSTSSSSSDSYNYDYDSSYYDSESSGETESAESHDSTATNSSSVSASAIQGAESNNGTPEGAVVAQATESEAGYSEVGSNQADPEAVKPVAQT
jgi:TatA/E family protein of Tat protein translocase